ncbi:hypothetical protein D3C78_1148840 [compost metagenome]
MLTLLSVSLEDRSWIRAISLSCFWVAGLPSLVWIQGLSSSSQPICASTDWVELPSLKISCWELPVWALYWISPWLSAPGM